LIEIKVEIDISRHLKGKASVDSSLMDDHW